jgi:hypothetical protein
MARCIGWCGTVSENEDISSYLKEKEIHSFEEFTYYLSNSFLKILASDILEVDSKIHIHHNK